MKLKNLRHDRHKSISSDDKPRAIKLACMAEVPTDDKPRAISSLHEYCRGAEEEGEAKEEDFVKLIYRTHQ